MAHLVPEQAAKRYEAAPPQSTVDAVKRLHTTIRDVLGSSYETFLQGSYKNDTATGDLDVDIVAIRKNTTSGVFAGVPATNPISWDTIFAAVRNLLEGSGYYQGKTTANDKCITIATQFTADVVPAVQIGNLDSDPIAIYSKREGKERKNFPRLHYANGVDKHARTGQLFKPTVRMFKVWARNHFPSGDRATPSFYLECLIYNFADSAFMRDPVERFIHIASVIASLSYASQRIMTVAGDKDILVESEWPRANFERFQAELRGSITEAQAAVSAYNSAEAVRLWRRAFNE
jgi:hypothetical protein